MKNELWIAVYDTFKVLGDVFEGDKPAAAPAPPEVQALPEPQGAPLPAVQMPLDHVVRARSRVRSQLDILRGKLCVQLSERDCYLALFPIVAHFDELVQTHYLRTDHRSWPPLQAELFQIDDAGEVFYDTLDDLMLKPQTLPFIYEVFYLCLNHGFVGRYSGNQAKLNEYLERLRAKIPVAEAGSLVSQSQEISSLQEFRSPIWYYVVVGGILVAFFFLLLAMAGVWNPLM